jgi:hypothetical protein
VVIFARKLKAVELARAGLLPQVVAQAQVYQLARELARLPDDRRTQAVGQLPVDPRKPVDLQAPVSPPSPGMALARKPSLGMALSSHNTLVRAWSLPLELCGRLAPADPRALERALEQELALGGPLVLEWEHELALGRLW